MSVTELAERVGITISNISILKNGKAKALKISTLAKLCELWIVNRVTFWSTGNTKSQSNT